MKHLVNEAKLKLMPHNASTDFGKISFDPFFLRIKNSQSCHFSCAVREIIF